MILIATFLLSHSENLPVLAACGAAAGIFCFYKGFRFLQRKRLILNTPSSKIRSASMGLVEISGLAIGPYVLTSPLKQVECYYYRSVAWQLKQQGKNTEWVKVAEEILHVPFYLDDNTGRVLVDPRGADMDLHCDMQEKYHRSVFFSGPEMPGYVADFLLRHGADPEKQIKVEEYCIKPKNALFVLGTLSQNPGLDASIMPAWAGRAGLKQINWPAASVLSRDSELENTIAAEPENVRNAPEIIRLSDHPNPAVPVTAMTQQQKIAAALMKAGVSNPATWAAAGVGAKPMAAESKAVKTLPAKPDAAPVTVPVPLDDTFDATGFDLHPPVVLMQGTNNRAFFISWRSQRDVIKTLGWKSTLMIWGGPVLTLASVYVVLAYFHWL
jgi:hypothetical protein